MKFIKDHKNGIIGTLLINGFILILLIFLGFTTPLPLPEEEGIMINFGYDDAGSGVIEPENNANTDNRELVNENSNSSQSESEDSKLTQDFEDAPEVNQNTEKPTEKTKEQIEQERKDKEQQELENSLSNSFNNSDNNNNSSSQGTNGTSGNEGDPNGDPNTNGNGVGTKGISYSLGGRKANDLPKPAYTTNEGGVVVVEITVDPNGLVKTATPGMPGSTTNNSVLLSAAKKAALKTKFNKKAGAPSKQIGTITYRFILR
jgi:outer membrane biosynthesis protein TonB